MQFLKKCEKCRMFSLSLEFLREHMRFLTSTWPTFCLPLWTHLQGFRCLFCRHWKPKGFLPSIEVCLHPALCRAIILLPRFLQQPCRLSGPMGCSVFFIKNARCDSEYDCQHLQSGWLPEIRSWRCCNAACDSWWEGLLILSSLPTWRTRAQAPSAALLWWARYAVWGTSRNIALTLAKMPHGCQLAKSINLRKLHLLDEVLPLAF